jgi:hypothetical protein
MISIIILRLFTLPKHLVLPRTNCQRKSDNPRIVANRTALSKQGSLEVTARRANNLLVRVSKLRTGRSLYKKKSYTKMNVKD